MTQPCANCHNGSVAAGKGSNHINTTNTCDDCHVTAAWRPVTRVDHGAVLGTCASCHNGVTALGKSPTHLPTTAACDDCHTTAAWTGARFDHSNVTQPCATCHNGSVAAGKGSNHINTTNTCDDCHVTAAWRPVTRVDHGAVLGTCASCHNGVTALGKSPTHLAHQQHLRRLPYHRILDGRALRPRWGDCPMRNLSQRHSCATGKHPQHIQTTGQCDVCHTTLAWTPANFDHGTVTGGCGSCHNGVSAVGKGAGHFVTTLECNACHNTQAWTPIDFRHNSPNYPGDHSSESRLPRLPPGEFADHDLALPRLRAGLRCLPRR